MLADPPPGLMLVKARLGVQLGFSHPRPSPAEAAMNCRRFRASELAEGQAKTVFDTGLHTNPFQETQSQLPSGRLQTTLEQDPRNFTISTSKERPQQALNAAVADSAVIFFILFFLFFSVFVVFLSVFFSFSVFLF